MMKKALKNKLLNNFKAVRVLPSFPVIVFIILSVLITFAIFLLLSFGIRKDFVSFFSVFHLESILIFALCFLQAIQFCFSGIPGKRFVLLKILSIFICFSLLVYWFLNGPYVFIFNKQSWFYFDSTFSCALKVSFMTAFVAFILSFFKSYFVFFQRGWSGFYLISIAAFLAWFVIRNHCYLTNHMHILLWHIFPVLLFSVLGYFLGRYLFKKI